MTSFVQRGVPSHKEVPPVQNNPSSQRNPNWMADKISQSIASTKQHVQKAGEWTQATMIAPTSHAASKLFGQTLATPAYLAKLARETAQNKQAQQVAIYALGTVVTAGAAYAVSQYLPSFSEIAPRGEDQTANQNHDSENTENGEASQNPSQDPASIDSTLFNSTETDYTVLATSQVSPLFALGLMVGVAGLFVFKKCASTTISGMKNLVKQMQTPYVSPFAKFEGSPQIEASAFVGTLGKLKDSDRVHPEFVTNLLAALQKVDVQQILEKETGSNQSNLEQIRKNFRNFNDDVFFDRVFPAIVERISEGGQEFTPYLNVCLEEASNHQTVKNFESLSTAITNKNERDVREALNKIIIKTDDDTKRFEFFIEKLALERYPECVGILLAHYSSSQDTFKTEFFKAALFRQAAVGNHWIAVASILTNADSTVEYDQGMMANALKKAFNGISSLDEQQIKGLCIFIELAPLDLRRALINESYAPLKALKDTHSPHFNAFVLALFSSNDIDPSNYTLLLGDFEEVRPLVKGKGKTVVKEDPKSSTSAQKPAAVLPVQQPEPKEDPKSLDSPAQQQPAAIEPAPLLTNTTPGDKKKKKDSKTTEITDTPVTPAPAESQTHQAPLSEGAKRIANGQKMLQEKGVFASPPATAPKSAPPKPATPAPAPVAAPVTPHVQEEDPSSKMSMAEKRALLESTGMGSAEKGQVQTKKTPPKSSPAPAPQPEESPAVEEPTFVPPPHNGDGPPPPPPPPSQQELDKASAKVLRANAAISTATPEHQASISTPKPFTPPANGVPGLTLNAIKSGKNGLKSPKPQALLGKKDGEVKETE